MLGSCIDKVTYFLGAIAFLPSLRTPIVILPPVFSTL